MPSQLQTSPALWPPWSIGVSFILLFCMRKWDEWPMDMVFMQLPRSPGVADSHNSRCGCPPPSTSPCFSGLPRALAQNKHISLLHAHHQTQGNMLPASPGVSTLSHYRPQQHTQRNIRFMGKPNASQKLLLSFSPGSQGITFRVFLIQRRKISNDLKTPLHWKSSPTTTTSPGHPSPPHRMAEE